jgi:hypothetical protein
MGSEINFYFTFNELIRNLNYIAIAYFCSFRLRFTLFGLLNIILGTAFLTLIDFKTDFKNGFKV